MTFLACAAIVLIVAILASVMVINGFGPGRYRDPVVASHVVKGTIHDRNGRVLAMEVPANNLYIRADRENEALISQILASAAGIAPDTVIAAIEKAEESAFILLREDLDAAVAETVRSAAADAGLGNLIEIRKESRRTYPAGFHAAQLIGEAETAMASVLSPNPGYDESTTYGSDLYLTIDIDVQYLLDLAVQQVSDVQHPDYAVGLVVDIESGEVLADTTYPFYDLNDCDMISDQQKVNRALVTSMGNGRVSVDGISVVSRIADRSGNERKADSQSGFTADLPAISALASSHDGYTADVVLVPESNPKYMVFIASVNPRFYQISSVLSLAVKSIEEGLAAQRKL